MEMCFLDEWTWHITYILDNEKLYKSTSRETNGK